MARYHVNTSTGMVNVCRAKVRCPFGGEISHFESQDEARRAYETLMTGQGNLELLLSSPQSPLMGSDYPQDVLASTHNENVALMEKLDRKDRQQLINYTYMGHETVNSYLRGYLIDEINASDEDRINAMARESVSKLDAAFEQELSGPRVVYRYARTRDESVDEYVSRFTVGETWSDPGFLSSSATVDYPLYHIIDRQRQGKHFVLMEMAVAGGVSLQFNDEYQAGRIQSLENEILLNRNTSFKVINVSQRKVKFGKLGEIFLDKDAMFGNRNYAKLNQRSHAATVIQLAQIV